MMSGSYQAFFNILNFQILLGLSCILIPSASADIRTESKQVNISGPSRLKRKLKMLMANLIYRKCSSIKSSVKRIGIECGGNFIEFEK